MVCKILNETSNVRFVCLDDLVTRGLDPRYCRPSSGAGLQRSKSVSYPLEYDPKLSQIPVSELRIMREYHGRNDAQLVKMKLENDELIEWTTRPRCRKSHLQIMDTDVQKRHEDRLKDERTCARQQIFRKQNCGEDCAQLDAVAERRAQNYPDINIAKVGRVMQE